MQALCMRGPQGPTLAYTCCPSPGLLQQPHSTKNEIECKQVNFWSTIKHCPHLAYAFYLSYILRTYVKMARFNALLLALVLCCAPACHAFLRDVSSWGYDGRIGRTLLTGGYGPNSNAFATADGSVTAEGDEVSSWKAPEG